MSSDPLMCVASVVLGLLLRLLAFSSFFFFFTVTASAEIYTLSLHDALPICRIAMTLVAIVLGVSFVVATWVVSDSTAATMAGDRKSTRLNSSHTVISYAVFCLKKKKKIHDEDFQVTSPAGQRYTKSEEVSDA